MRIERVPQSVDLLVLENGTIRIFDNGDFSDPQSQPVLFPMG